MQENFCLVQEVTLFNQFHYAFLDYTPVFASKIPNDLKNMRKSVTEVEVRFIQCRANENNARNFFEMFTVNFMSQSLRIEGLSVNFKVFLPKS